MRVADVITQWWLQLIGRFDQDHWFAEVVVMIQKLLLYLVVGVLQKYEQSQAVAALVINALLLVFYLASRPFNEWGRWIIEVVAQGLFTAAIALVMFNAFHIDLDFDVGMCVTMLMISGFTLKMLYHFANTANAIILKLLAICKTAESPSLQGSTKSLSRNLTMSVTDISAAEVSAATPLIIAPLTLLLTRS